MTERINKILKYLNTNSSKFADEIGVQRSSISHVLSGRNKPSLDFIQKLLKTYPEINAEWLITGGGKMTNEESQGEGSSKKSDDKPTQEFEERIEEKVSQQIDFSQSDLNMPKKAEQYDSNQNISVKIRKIVFFYSDDSFKEYHPEE